MHQQRSQDVLCHQSHSAPPKRIQLAGVRCTCDQVKPSTQEPKCANNRRKGGKLDREKLLVVDATSTRLGSHQNPRYAKRDWKTFKRLPLPHISTGLLIFERTALQKCEVYMLVGGRKRQGGVDALSAERPSGPATVTPLLTSTIDGLITLRLARCYTALYGAHTKRMAGAG